MACSIEARTPFLDYRVVEACLGMPAEYKIGGGVSKRVLRGSMRGIVPDRILDRKDKMGFVTAENTWLKGEAKAQFRKAIQESLDRFPGMILERLLTDFDAVTQDNKGFDHRYWRVINLGYWGRAYNIFL
jgi:asparagine synthase (glutamine-hydrolysing)